MFRLQTEPLAAAQMLERFLFRSGPCSGHLIGKLSGGEKRRLYLLRILMDSAQCTDPG